jgi:hypothetical protein
MNEIGFWQQNGFTIILEFSSVFVGIVLALALTQWHQDRMSLNTAKIMMQQLIVELDKNRQLASSSIESIDKTLPKLIEAYEVSLERRKNGVGDPVDIDQQPLDLVMPLLTDSVWQLALLRGSTDYLSIEQAQTLFRVYRGQAFLTEQNQHLNTLMFSYSNDIEEMQILIASLQQIHQLQGMLVVLYDTVIADLSDI